MTTFLKLEKITKKFSKIVANKDVTIEVKKGEIIGLLGENGAGKSTLMNVLFGLYKPTSGRVLINDKPVKFSSPKDAKSAGLSMIHQHFMLVDNMSVTENIILGQEPNKMGFINYKEAREKVIALSHKYNLEIDPDAKIEDIAVGVQQRVEILKALFRDTKLLIMDEPTAVLTPQEVIHLFEVVRKLRADGMSVIIITHKLDEASEISDRIYILRNGELVDSCNACDVDSQMLATMMVGRDIIFKTDKKPRKETGIKSFKLQDLSYKKMDGTYAIKNLNLEIEAGEIYGIAGVDGNGQKELAEVVRGMVKEESGEIIFNEKVINKYTTLERMQNHMGYIPADRLKFGLIPAYDMASNLIIGEQDEKKYTKKTNPVWRRIVDVLDNILGEYNPVRGLSIINKKAVIENAKEVIKKYDIRPNDHTAIAGYLSGGNQQKVVVGREIERKPEFILIVQPTWGVDVGAIERIHEQILAMRDCGVCILLISLELEEIFTLSDKIAVLYEGKIVLEKPAHLTNKNEVGLYMTGGSN